MKSRSEKNIEKALAIEDEKKKEKQKKVIKIIIKILLVIFLLTFLFFLYVTEVSTTSIIVKETYLEDEKIPSSFHGYKIINFSDFHNGDISLLKTAVKEINKRKPDLILFTGDLLDGEEVGDNKRKTIIQELKKLDSNSLKFAVLGEDDISDSSTILTESSFTVLNNNYELIYQDDLSSILLMGLSNNNNLEDLNSLLGYYSIPDHNEDIFSILMLHMPDSIDDVIERRKIDLAFAGHSHLGEIRLGLPIGIKDGAKKYIDDYYDIDGTKFYISSGISTDMFDFRFGARPSITFIRLNSKAS